MISEKIKIFNSKGLSVATDITANNAGPRYAKAGDIVGLDGTFVNIVCDSCYSSELAEHLNGFSKVICVVHAN